MNHEADVVHEPRVRGSSDTDPEKNQGRRDYVHYIS